MVADARAVYDVAQHLLNDRDRLTADPRGFARRMAGLTGVDGDRVITWLFARCVVEAAWWPYDLIPVAWALAGSGGRAAP